MDKRSIEKLDLNFAAAAAGDGLCWTDSRQLMIDGRGWTDRAHDFDRFPARAEGLVPPSVWELGHRTAGMAVRFRTAARTLAARWTLRFESLSMNHMPATGVSGLDLYVRLGDAWRWTATGIPSERQTQQTLLEGLDPGQPREYLLYLPLYNGIDAFEIGISAEAELQPPTPWSGKAICFYGTSITQGGCASRPGACYTAIIARALERSHYNFGFSGNGRMEPALAELLAELDCAVYVLDAFPNMNPEQIRERLGPFVRLLRRARPHTPIVVVDNLHYANYPLVERCRQSIAAKNGAARDILRELHDEGVTRLTQAPGDILLGADREGTVDGTHPNDLGFMRMAEALIPFLRPLL